MEGREGFSDLELDGLREFMNIGFGQAAVALSEVMDLYVTLTVPRISLLDSGEVASFIGAEIGLPRAWGMVEQFFYGNFEGMSFLLLPEGEGRKMASLFSPEAVLLSGDSEIGSLERDMFTEVGNILIGACVGKIAELLGDRIAFQPPRFLPSPLDLATLGRRLAERKGLALVFKTVFEFEKEDIEGQLFLVASERSVLWMRRALAAYIGKLG
jgi:chemotaxis protein CheC